MHLIKSFNESKSRTLKYFFNFFLSRMPDLDLIFISFYTEIFKLASGRFHQLLGIIIWLIHFPSLIKPTQGL